VLRVLSTTPAVYAAVENSLDGSQRSHWNLRRAKRFTGFLASFPKPFPAFQNRAQWLMSDLAADLVADSQSRVGGWAKKNSYAVSLFRVKSDRINYATTSLQGNNSLSIKMDSKFRKVSSIRRRFVVLVKQVISNRCWSLRHSCDLEPSRTSFACICS
jgi:hypothetical protein